jgi:hypothetical protein
MNMEAAVFFMFHPCICLEGPRGGTISAGMRTGYFPNTNLTPTKWQSHEHTFNCSSSTAPLMNYTRVSTAAPNVGSQSNIHSSYKKLFFSLQCCLHIKTSYRGSKMGFQNRRWHGFQFHDLRVEFHNRTIGTKAITSSRQVLSFPHRTQNKESRLQIMTLIVLAMVLAYIPCLIHSAYGANANMYCISMLQTGRSRVRYPMR